MARGWLTLASSEPGRNGTSATARPNGGLGGAGDYTLSARSAWPR